MNHLVKVGLALAGGALAWKIITPSSAQASQGASLGPNAGTPSGDVIVVSGDSLRFFGYPFVSDSNQITIDFGLVTKSSGGTRQHEGIDIRAALGTPVLAGGPGTVVHASCHTGTYGFYGNTVEVRHDLSNGAVLYALYAHLREFLVTVGQRVQRGTVLAYSGGKDHPCTGNSDGPHLHMELRADVNDRGHAVDPTVFFDNAPNPLYTDGARRRMD